MTHEEIGYMYIKEKVLSIKPAGGTYLTVLETMFNMYENETGISLERCNEDDFEYSFYKGKSFEDCSSLYYYFLRKRLDIVFACYQRIIDREAQTLQVLVRWPDYDRKYCNNIEDIRNFCIATLYDIAFSLSFLKTVRMKQHKKDIAFGRIKNKRSFKKDLIAPLNIAKKIEF